MERPIYSIDWLSRIMAAGSLIASGVAAAYIFSNPTTATTPEALSAAIKAELQESGDDTILDQRVQVAVANSQSDQNQQIKTVLSRINTDAENMLRGWKVEQARMATAFNRRMQERAGSLVAEAAPNPSAVSSTDQDTGDAEVPPAQALKGLGPFDDDPAGALRFVSVNLRPNNGNESSLLRIFNEGEASARITQISFEPKQVFKIDKTSLEAASGAKDTKTMVFIASDNQATEEGKHHHYVRKLTKPLLIQPDKDVLLRIEIWDSSHYGFGFSGNVIVTYDDLRTITEKAQVVFRNR